MFLLHYLLNSKNIVGVYNATGNPDDDGYLSAPEWQREINSQIDPQAFIQMYSLYVNAGGNYSMPRHISPTRSTTFWASRGSSAERWTSARRTSTKR